MTAAAGVRLTIDGEPLQVPAGITVAAALALQAEIWTRRSVLGEARAPFCGMGVCQECRVSINGLRRLACQTLCEENMVIERTR